VQLDQVMHMIIATADAKDTDAFLISEFPAPSVIHNAK